MKSVEIDPAIQADPELLPLVRQATELLESQLGRSSGLVSAEWVPFPDERGLRVVQLKISDWTGSVWMRFTSDGLSNPDRVRVRLHALWGDLLQVRSDAQVAELQHLIDDPDRN